MDLAPDVIADSATFHRLLVILVKVPYGLHRSGPALALVVVLRTRIFHIVVPTLGTYGRRILDKLEYGSVCHVTSSS
jgi:hypothetical protein